MRFIFLITLLILRGISLACQAQVGLPGKSRQNQFIWEQSATPYIGLNQNELDSVFRSIVHTEHAVALVLSVRTDSIPNEWSELGPICDYDNVNLSCSHRYLKPGLSSFIVPIPAIPQEFSTGEWTLIINGEEWPVVPGTKINAEISSNTESITVGLRLGVDGAIYESHLLLPVLGTLNCPEPDLPPWPILNDNDPYWVGVFDDGEAITGQALVKIGADGTFNKPIILVEGFDPDVGGHSPTYGFGDLNWEVIWNCDGSYNDALGGLGTMLDAVQQEGFDLVFLDFENGTRSIFQQAKLLQYVIEQCRDYRTGVDPLIVVGPSMGGVVARETLRSMELEGMDHCVRLFAALDSPFRGAYLPIALQEAIAFFSEFSVDANLLLEALNSPAASELLVGSPFHSANIRSNIEAHQEQQGYPTECVNMAIVNSNPYVLNVAPTSWYSATETFIGWDYINIHLHGQPGSLTHPQSAANAPVIFEASLINPSYEWGDPVLLDGVAWSDINLLDFESLSGSTSTHLVKFKEALSLVGIEPDSYTPHSIYVPALSALDIPIEHPFSTAAIEFDEWSIEPIETSPAPHCNVSQHFEALWNQIVHGQPLLYESGEIDTTLCMGHQTPFQQTIIESIGEGESNVSVDIGTTPCNGPGVWPLFTSKTSSCSPAISIAPDHTLRIGDSLGQGTSHAHFTIARGGSLIVQGTLHIGPHSTLLIEEDAELILQGGTIRVDPFGTILQQSNSQIKTEGNGRIFLNGPQATWSNEGIVHLNPFDSLLVTSEYPHQIGDIELNNQTGYTFLGNHSLFQIKGDNNAAIELILTPNAKRAVEGDGKYRMDYVNLHFHDQAEWHFNTKCHFTQVNATGYTPINLFLFQNRLRWQNGTLAEMHIRTKNGGIAGTILQNISANACSMNIINTGLRLNNCEFKYSSVACENIEPHSWVTSCLFTEGWDNIPQLKVLNTLSNILLESNRFQDHDIGFLLFNSKSTANCNKWEGNQIGIVLDSLSTFNAQSPYGKNQWNDNEVHFQCHAANLPTFQNGANQFGEADDALFLGTINYPVNDEDLTTGYQPYVVLQSGNMWPNATISVPLVIPYVALESTVDGNQINFMDQNPAYNSCTNSEEIQVDSSPKRGTIMQSDTTKLLCHIFPNPASEELHIHIGKKIAEEDAKFVVFDATGRSIYFQALETTATNAFKIPVWQLDNGWYIFQLQVSGAPKLQKPFIIQR